MDSIWFLLQVVRYTLSNKWAFEHKGPAVHGAADKPTPVARHSQLTVGAPALKQRQSQLFNASYSASPSSAGDRVPALSFPGPLSCGFKLIHRSTTVLARPFFGIISFLSGYTCV